MYTYANTDKYKYRRTLLFRYKMLLLTSDFGSSTWRDRHNSYYANHPQCVAHLVVFKISVGRDPKILTTTATVENSTLCLWGRELNYLPPWSNVNLQLTLFSKSSNSQDYLFQAWCHPHSSPISCLGFDMTMVIVISFARERKTVPNDCAPELRAK